MHQTGLSLTVLALTLTLPSFTFAGAGDAQLDNAWMNVHLQELVVLYKELHGRPELSGSEFITATRLAEELRKAGADVVGGGGGRGVVGVLHNGSGPTVLVRCEMDALQVTE